LTDIDSIHKITLFKLLTDILPKPLDALRLINYYFSDMIGCLRLAFGLL
jgi:hypothetical protein